MDAADGYTPKALAKRVARAVLGDYAAYYIYRRRAADVDAASAAGRIRVEAIDAQRLRASDDPTMRAQAGYAGEGAYTYAALGADDQLLGVCFYWYGARYLTRNFWPLADREVKLVQIIVSPAARGQGIATELIKASETELFERGFLTAYARIWHSNVPSWRAFERCGWRRIALMLEINPLRRARPLRLRLPLGRVAQNA